MLLRPQLNLLALLALSAFAQANWFEDTLNEVYRRQADENDSAATSGNGSGVTSSSVSPSPSPSPSPTPTPSPTPSITPSVTPTPSSSTLSSSTPSNSSSTSKTESSTTTSAPDTSTTTSNVSKTIIRITQIVTKDGETITSVSESTSTLPTPTNAAELTQNNDSSGGGMSPKTKSTVIGVVVGIGGAIILGGLAVVAWRIWGRKKRPEEREDMVDYGRPDTGAEKTLHSSAGSSTNPFQKTLENYHNPDRKLNASSNF